MSFLRKRFIQNICRACKKTFCCEKCKVQHERNTHNILPNCDICNYGRIVSSRVLQLPGLHEHLKQSHYPLNCIFCKLKFSSVSELMEHTKCSVGPPKIELQHTKTPMRPVNVIQEDPDFNSPPVNILINSKDIAKIFGTSTPMQGQEVEYEMVPETITPVDNMERKAKIQSANENLSNPYSNEEHKNNKRRVTFNETPQMEHGPRFENLPALKNFDVNCHADDSCSGNQVDAVKEPNEMLSNELLDNKENKIRENPLPLKKRRSSIETIWQSAVEEQLHVDDDDEQIFVEDNPKQKSTDDIKTINESSYDCSYSFVSKSDLSHEMSSNYMEESVNLSSGKNNGIWSSMAFMMKNMVKGFSKPGVNGSLISHKRLLSDSELIDVEMRKCKRIKLTEIKCRPPIRNYIRKFKTRKRFVEKVDKSTQTDDSICPKDLI